ncbi:hypothetical protein YC2023_024379 [Brassica napus]|uniref:Uncharacterized protein n=2 Tax=Brassica TaxID=3705 RepID=M4F4H0_BRACM|nr:unnamed protein product [Brassica napus]
MNSFVNFLLNLSNRRYVLFNSELRSVTIMSETETRVNSESRQKDVIGRVHDLGDVLTVKAQGEDRKRVEFRLVDSHLSAANSQLATVEKSTGKKDGKRIQFDWNDAEIKPISEIMDATQVVLLDSSSSEDPKTPYSKRKEDDADLPDLTSTSKKLCTKVIKHENAKTD